MFRVIVNFLHEMIWFRPSIFISPSIYFVGNPEAVPEHDTILKQLDEETNPQLAYLDDYDSQTVKQRAMNNVNSAFHAHQQKAQQFDSSSVAISTNPLDEPRGNSFNKNRIARGFHFGLPNRSSYPF